MIAKKKYTQFYILVIFVLLIAFFFRSGLVLFFQQGAGDQKYYLFLAENLLNGCGFSKSDPSTNECELLSAHYFPGFPAFMASIWYLFGKSNSLILICNIICYLLSLFWLLRSLLKFTNNFKIVISIGIIMALSPLQIGWFRFVFLTEPLAIATATWFLAELILSICYKKIRILPLALCLSCSVFIRPDTILMSLSILPIVFYIYNFKKAVIKLLIIALLTSLPVGIWSLRNISIGHDPISFNEKKLNDGFDNWGATWWINEYERAEFGFPIAKKTYSIIRIHESKYIDEDEMKIARDLINKLSKYDGMSFPQDINQQFQKLTDDKLKNRNFITKIEIIAKRSIYMLFNPFASWGMPFEMISLNRKNFGDAFWTMDLHYLSNFVIENFYSILGKIIIFLYRIVLFFGLAFFLIKNFYSILFRKNIENHSKYSIILWATLIYFLIRILFFSLLANLESRYLIEPIIWIECIVVLYMFDFKKKLKNK